MPEGLEVSIGVVELTLLEREVFPEAQRRVMPLHPAEVAFGRVKWTLE